MTDLANLTPDTGMGDLPGDSGVVAATYGVAALASTGLGFYHGYKRNGDSFGWGLAWAFAGSLFPIVTPAFAFAQGFGQPAKS